MLGNSVGATIVAGAPEPGPPKGSRDVVMVQGNASQGKDGESQEGTPQVIPIHTPAPKKGSLNVAEPQVGPSNAPSPSMTGPAVFEGASNFSIDGTPIFNSAGNNVYWQNVTNNFNYEKEKENLNKKLREKLNPIINPVKKQIYCAEGTRLQLLNDITQWVLKPDNHYVAWIYGLAGSGKSAVAVSLAERLREMNNQVTLALTFHCVKGQETSSTCQLVPTICYHLAQYSPEYANALVDIFEKDASLHADSIPIREQLSCFLQPLYQMAQNQYATSTIIIIDELDEWGKPADQYTFLTSLQSHLARIGRIYIIVTSRQERDIARAMNKSSMVQSFDLTASYPAHKDIAKFFEMYFSETIADEISEHDIDALTKRAGNLFIWANTAVNYLKLQYSVKLGVEALLNTKGKTGNYHVGNPHAELYDLYAAVLHNIPRLNSPLGIQLFQLVIGLIISAYEPFTVKALTKMLEEQSQVPINYLMTGQQIGNPLHGHTSPVTSVAFSPDGQQVVSGSYDQTVRIWYLQTGQQIGAPLRGHTGAVTSVAFSPDGQQGVSGSYDQTVRIWDVLTGQQIGNPLHGHTSQVTSVAFSPDGQQVVSGSDDETLRRWNVQTGQQVADPLHGHTSGVTSVAFSPDGQQVVSGSYDETVRIWNVLTGQQIGDPLHGHTSGVTSLAFSPDAQQVVSGSDDRTVRIWNVQTGQQIGDLLRGHTSGVTSVAFSPNAQQVVSGSDDETLRMWNVQTGQQIGDPLHGHTELVTSVAFSPDAQQVVSGSDDKTVRMWNVQTGQQIGDPLYGHTDSVTSVAFSPDGQQVVSGSYDETVRMWNVQTGQQIGDPLHGHTNSVTSVAFSPNAQQVVSGSYDQIVRIWTVQTEQQNGDLLHGHTSAVTSVAFSPDAQQVVSGSDDETVRMWNVQTGQQIGDPLYGHTDSVTSVAFSPDGQQVVSGSYDETVRMWNIQTGQQIGDPPHGHTNQVTSVAFSPDGQQVVSGSDDKTVRIWNVQTGPQIGDPLHGHPSVVTSVAFSPDGQQVISGSHDNTARILTAHAGRQVGLPPNSPITIALPTVSSSNPHFPHDNSLQLPPTTSHGYINPQGWLCSDNNDLLLWLLPWMVPGFRDKRQVLTIPPDTLNCSISVNWDFFVYGSSWAQCWDSSLFSDDI
ncbi:hypothetical protein D9757_015069 [Collybiopsis confluens]|uniref:Nephrocystin 3-like N-terminal domain-containing protein n=1 Tax=Collybiopsis confluens TaxID=2823264 RepID=A0A8H5CU66_9AGAR|nr:hypothetical protein D9757_015069 [Collybiopsis confluens]